MDCAAVSPSSPMASVNRPTPDTVPSATGLGVLNAPRTFWWGAFFGIWTLQVALYAAVTYHQQAGTEDPLTFGEALITSALDWYLWAAICLFCLWLATRLPLEENRWRTLVPVFLVLGVAVTLARGVLDYVLLALLGWEQMSLGTRLVVTFPGRFILFVLFVGVGYAVDYARRHRDRELRAANLRAELATAQLQMLKVQLHPHFLFNTLHAISSLMYTDVAAADRMLVRLSELLRRTLQAMDAQKVDLAEELSFLDLYLKIEQARLGPRLQVEMNIDEDATGALVPHLILQPLVENAIRHGIAPKLRGGTLAVTARRAGADLILEVRDDGVGFPASGSSKEGGVGLANTRRRIEQMYRNADLNITELPGGGTEVRVRLPFEPATRLLPAAESDEAAAVAGGAASGA